MTIDQLVIHTGPKGLELLHHTIHETIKLSVGNMGEYCHDLEVGKIILGLMKAKLSYFH